MPLQKTEGPVYNPNAKKDPSQQVQKDPSQQGQRDPYDVLAKKALQKSAQLPVRSDAPPNAIDPKKETKMDVKDKKSKRVDSKVSSKKKKTGPEGDCDAY